MKPSNIKLHLGFYLALAILFWSKLAHAQSLPCTDDDEFGGICLPTKPSASAPSFDNAAELVGFFLNIALMVAGLVSAVFVVIGGYKYLTAGGDEEKVTKAKKSIFNALIGLVVVLLALVIIRVVANLVGGQI